MKRLRAFLPLLVLIAIGIALLASGVLDRFEPQRIAQEQADLHARIAAHPLPAGTAVNVGWLPVHSVVVAT